jgi:hemerythrin
MPTWTPALAVGHPIIDDQHRELFARADDLIQAMAEGRAMAELEQLLVFLRDYCRDHFGTEERLMVSRGYPALQAHRLAHREFERRFHEIERSVATRGATAAVVLEVKDLLRGWLTHHIGAVDIRLAAFLKAKTA